MPLPHPTSPPSLSARDLLLGFLELREYAPDLGSWAEEQLANNPPRLVRLQRLRALFRAFDIPWDPAGFTRGDFVGPDVSRYADFVARAKAEMPPMPAESDRLSHIGACFATLLEYREQLEGLLSFNSGVLAASGLYAYAHLKAGRANVAVRAQVEPIEAVLVELISPESKRVPLSELKGEFGYPEADLGDIDEEWF